MAEDLGISLKAGAWSLFDGLSQGSYSPTVTSDGIEQAQNNLMAKQHYSKGIDYYEKNDAYAAHYCFSQAIKFNPVIKCMSFILHCTSLHCLSAELFSFS